MRNLNCEFVLAGAPIFIVQQRRRLMKTFEYLLDVRERKGPGFCSCWIPDKLEDEDLRHVVKHAQDSGVDAFLVGSSLMTRDIFRKIARRNKKECEDSRDNFSRESFPNFKPSGRDIIFIGARFEEHRLDYRKPCSCCAAHPAA